MQLSTLLDALVDPEVDEMAARSEIPCRVQDAELWFAELPAHVEQAKALCRDCPVRTACLAGARERREPWGVWGGELFANGKILANKRRRGRPPKVRPPEPVLDELVPRYDPSYQVAESA